MYARNPDRDIRRDVSTSIRMAINEHFPGVDEGPITEMVNLLSGPLAVLVDSFKQVKEIDYESVAKTAHELTGDLIKMKGIDEGVDASVLDEIIDTFGLSVARRIEQLVRQIRPEPLCSILRRFAAYNRHLRATSICARCGKPREGIIPVRGAKICDAGDDIYDTGGRPMSRQDAGLCICEEVE